MSASMTTPANAPATGDVTLRRPDLAPAKAAAAAIIVLLAVLLTFNAVAVVIRQRLRTT